VCTTGTLVLSEGYEYVVLFFLDGEGLKDRVDCEDDGNGNSNSNSNN
jgi:hypothetical protein